MRTPKYKAFYKPHNYIYHVTDMNFEGPDYTLREVKLSNGIWVRSDKLDDIILIEQTPYTDKNGKEIYEGEILYNNDRKEHCIVKYSKEKAMFIVKYLESNDKFPLWESISNLYYSVGNLYENPELLENKLSD